MQLIIFNLNIYIKSIIFILGIGPLQCFAHNIDCSLSENIVPLGCKPKLYQQMQAAEPALCQNFLKDLDYVTVKYWGFDNKEHVGVLLAHKELSQDIVEIFEILLDNHFPIEKIQTSGHFPNTTLMYNCREVTDQPGYLSQHSYGRAIDINPLVNPYVKGEIVIPEGGERYIDRNQSAPGKIRRDSLITQLFIERGWDWGGSWFDLVDYQHFEKRANGEKRNPYGYVK